MYPVSWFNWKVSVESGRLEVVRDDKWSGIIRNNAERVVYLPPFVSSSRLHRAILRPFPRTISQARQHYAPPFCWRHVTRYFLPGSFIVDESSTILSVSCTAWPLFTVTRLIYRHRFFKQVSRSIFIMQLEEKNLFNLSTIRG